MTISSSQKTYTAAVIGCGKAGNHPFQKGGGHKIGYTHATMYKTHPRINLTGAADINPENLQAWQREFSVTGGHTDYTTMLRELKPEIVSVCTYMGLHRPIIEAAVKAGVKGIFCEKPFLPSPVDCKAVAKLAESSGVKIVVAYIRRNRKVFQRAKELYSGGAVGRPVMCMQAIEGWDLSEMGAHTLDMFRYFHNDAPVKWVLGQARVCDTRGYGHAMEDHAIVNFAFEGGGRGFVDGGKGMNDQGAMTLLGSEGVIRIISEQKLIIEDARGRTIEEFENPYGPAWDGLWTQHLSHLIDWIGGGPAPMAGLPNALKTSELNLAAYLSAVRGDRVDLPLEDDTTEWPVEILARRRTT